MIGLRRGNIRLAYRSLKVAKGRSLLTMFGIIVGVMAVVLVICIGQGVKRQISQQIGHYGKDVFTVQPGTPTAVSGLFGAGFNGTSTLLSGNDLQAIQQTKGVAKAVPLATTSGTMKGDFTVRSPLIIATTSDFPNVVSQNIAAGGFFDNTISNKTVVLGQSIAHRLFSDNAPLGQVLTWRGQQFIVAGVFGDFKAPPLSLAANFNDAVFVPYATAQSLSGSILGMYEIVAKADSPRTASATIQRVQSVLDKAHGGARDTTVQLATANGSASDQAIHSLTLLVTGAALIALVVGGVGIMNVLLVSVTERMHEIGLRKAIGATNRQIMRQFMAEAVVLSACGAILGLVAALAAIGLLDAFSSLHPALVWQAFVLVPLAAIAIGVLFGTAPALKAARKDPIEALRHE